MRHDLAVAGGGTLLIAAVLILTGRLLVRFGAGPVVTRKIPHALCGAFAALAAFQLSSGAVVACVLAVATVALALIVEKGLVPVPGVFDGTRIRDYGLVGFAAGALIAVLAFWPDRVAIAAGVLVLGLADAGAALVGHRFGRHRVAVSGAVRSLEGSVVFVAVAFTVSLTFCLTGLRMSLVVALAASAFVAVTTAAVELLVAPAADNLLITPWVALLLHVGRDLSDAAALHWLVGLAFGCAIVPFMLRMRWLDLPGAICGGLVAAVAVGLGGWAWIIPAAVFFSVTSVLTAYRRPKQTRGLRGMSQVAVNAGLPVVVPVLGYALTGAPVWFAVSIGGIAAGIADSWASEIGRFSSKEPLSLRSWRRVPKGTSGAVSPLGSAATVLGAVAVGGFGALFAGPAMILVGVVAGIVGSLTDTVIGATVQGRFTCPGCGAVVEDREHCSVPAVPRSGWRWVSNDAVNAVANAVGMLTGFAVGAVI
ncbi:DUF92 domain-containing protein [Mycobacterium sp. M1]|uniref:DUF92 domain-containing protein n=1 Tax=Mycolicibacter acidiphilus TaxID=2835306 RepID=A0ABS5REZ9_9MYCO|nr:DUF92 domain-containing protein [Mycolicibacter acidiphilus]